jgi:hypothetical protein
VTGVFPTCRWVKAAGALTSYQSLRAKGSTLWKNSDYAHIKGEQIYLHLLLQTLLLACSLVLTIKSDSVSRSTRKKRRTKISFEISQTTIVFSVMLTQRPFCVITDAIQISRGALCCTSERGKGTEATQSPWFPQPINRRFRKSEKYLNGTPSNERGSPKLCLLPSTFFQVNLRVDNERTRSF